MPAKRIITERPNGNMLILRRPTHRNRLRNSLIAQSAAFQRRIPLGRASGRLFICWLSLRPFLTPGVKPRAIDVGPSRKAHVAAVLDETGDSKDAQKSDTYPDDDPLNHRVEYPHGNSPVTIDAGEDRSFGRISGLHLLEIENG
jgi:hypothetical protein